MTKEDKKKKKEELPSFLLQLSEIPEVVPPKPVASDAYLGPIFFGRCNEFHPPLHSINFSDFRHIQKANFGRETIKDLFFPATEVEKKIRKVESVKFKHAFKKKLLYSDPFTHKCPGQRKGFAREFMPPVIDLGGTTSIIEGETTTEIPLYRLKKGSSGTTITEIEIIKFSDIQEKKRENFMTYNERISHIHFPKQFTTVSVIGPTIPAAITITKLPCKRKTKCEMNVLLESKIRKTSKDETKIKGDQTEEFKEDISNFSEEEKPTTADFSGIEENFEIQQSEDSDLLRNKDASEYITQEGKETEEETGEMAESDEVDTLEKVNGETGEAEINEENEENENQEEESPKEELET